MKKLLYIFTALALSFGAASCMPEDIVNDTNTPRHQIENLKAVVGDEEITLSWSVPEGWEPTDYQITYKDDKATEQKILTGGKNTYTITGLVNKYDYAFDVQAIYGKAISQPVGIAATPVTSRIPVKSLSCVTDPDKEKKEQYVQLTWEKPSDLVLNYTLTYYPEMTPEKVKTETLDKDATSYKIENITNEDNYVISLVANYPKGAAPETETTVYFKVAYFVSQTSAATGQVIRFEFNKEAYPTATDIKWVFPGGTSASGEVVEWTAAGVGKKEVLLSATVAGKTIEWPGIELNLRLLILEVDSFVQNGTNFNGFKGSHPVFSPDGKTIYNITFNGVSGLYAYDLATGTEKWRYIPTNKSSSYNPATVNPVTGDIYYGVQNNEIYCVSPEGSLKWTNSNFTDLRCAAPAVSADGKTVYAVDSKGRVAAIDAESGNELWNVKLAAGGGSILLNNDVLIVASLATANAIHFLNTANGSELAAAITLSKSPADRTHMAVSNDKKTAYIPLKGGGLASIDLTSNTLVQENIFAADNVWGPVVASNGYVVAGSKDGSIYALSADLKEIKWQYTTYKSVDVANNNGFNYAHLCADDQGRVYATSGGNVQNKIYVLNAADGTVLSSESYGENSEKQMGGNNFNDGFLFSAFIGATGHNGPMVGHYFGGQRKFWGGPGGDICGSSCVQSPLL